MGRITYPPHAKSARGVQFPATCRNFNRRMGDRETVHFWCDHCGTNHSNRLIAAECVRLLVNGPDPGFGS
ncbi:hypothetical protein [Mycobacterium sp. 852002-51152_SCH6134967]|uniref:hypothetical protein n=1 Tax=Mycobacterium sp. 852002-51152_SCH6134967 TaxID=1834096 RepID=UPI000AF294F9|nr:hypothetical protein [Mycobacterium sp. 852002-51152_SCH6134967]